MEQNIIPPEIVNAILPILKQYHIPKASLFGSYARGEQKPQSDVDLLIKAPKGMTLFGLGGLYSDLKEALKREVDIVQYDYIKPRLKDRILKDKIDIL
ncbi:MAG: nucleotidyltransferase family protein [Elusimicrobia bacterium]|nr:nucleotidyltransferase family protein [Elusimicrobiota bacterium]